MTNFVLDICYQSFYKLNKQREHNFKIGKIFTQIFQQGKKKKPIAANIQKQAQQPMSLSKVLKILISSNITIHLCWPRSKTLMMPRATEDMDGVRGTLILYQWFIKQCNHFGRQFGSFLQNHTCSYTGPRHHTPWYSSKQAENKSTHEPTCKCLYQLYS